METFLEYQGKTKETAFYPRETLLQALNYCVHGLTSEAGEVAGLLKKIIRDNNGQITSEQSVKLLKELGDVLWYVSQICNELDFSMSGVAAENINKLAARKAHGTLSGSGDNR